MVGIQSGRVGYKYLLVSSPWMPFQFGDNAQWNRRVARRSANQNVIIT